MRALAIALLLSGCTSVFGGETPVGCDAEDADGDGFLSEACLGAGHPMADCDDADAEVFPGAEERCNQRDDDCDGALDEDLADVVVYADCDGDAVGGEQLARSCDAALLDAPACPEGGGDWVVEPGDCDDADPTRQRSCGACGAVDVLMVVDDTAGAGAVQAQLATLMPALLEPLATGDLDGDGAVDVEPLAGLQVGMITTDMGSRGFDEPSCREADFGGDGLLVTRPEACADAVPPFSSFAPADEPGAFVQDALCHAAAGENGCVYGMPLEASLRALTPASSLRRFHPNPRGLGHGDLANEGFLREDSILLALMVTDGVDCSVAPGREALFDPVSGNDYPPGPLRCAMSSDELHLVERYTSGLLALRDAEDLVLAVSAGVPADLVAPTPDVAALDAVLADPRMTPMQDSMTGELVPSCTGSGVSAFPPRRLVELARGLRERGVTTEVGSVCSPAPDALADRLVGALLAARDRRCGS